MKRRRREKQLMSVLKNADIEKHIEEKTTFEITYDERFLLIDVLEDNKKSLEMVLEIREVEDIGLDYPTQDDIIRLENERCLKVTKKLIEQLGWK